MSSHTRSLVTFLAVFWVALGIGAALKIPTIIQNALEVKTDG